MRMSHLQEYPSFRMFTKLLPPFPITTTITAPNIQVIFHAVTQFPLKSNLYTSTTITGNYYA